MILLELPLKDLLLAQRVSRVFRNHINSSTKLQQALFFKPLTKDSLMVEHLCTNVTTCQTIAECSRERERSLPSDGNRPSCKWVGSGEPYKGWVIFNPFVGQRIGSIWYTEIYRFVTKQGTQNIESKNEPSWRKMLVTQPPLHEALIDSGKAKHWHLLKAKDTDPGLRGGHLADHSRSFESPYMTLLPWASLRNLARHPRQSTRLAAADVLGEMKKPHEA